MAELVESTHNPYSGITVDIYESRDDSHEPPTFYFACRECGNCSKHNKSRVVTRLQAYDHLDEHAG